MRRAVALVLALVAAPAAAHDFWIAPDRHRISEAKAEIRTTFRVGTAAVPEDWRLRRERVIALRSYGPDGVADQQADIEPGQPGYATLRFNALGSHIVTFETLPAESDLPADEFNAYAEHEGLAAVIAARKAGGKERANGRELYARRAKTIVQAGGKLTDVSRPLGLGLEIVPLTHPLGLKPGEPLPVTLHFRGRPLPGARLHIESLSGVTGANAAAITNAQGRASFTFPKQGAWKIAAVWSVPVADNPRADFDTLFASLTFGY